MRRPPMKPGAVQIFYGPESRGEPPELCVQYGGSGAGKRHGNALLSLIFGDAVLFGTKAWEARCKEAGFDITTLRISIEVEKPNPSHSQGTDQGSTT